jgi:MFS family permease
MKSMKSLDRVAALAPSPEAAASSSKSTEDEPSLRYAWYVVLILMVCYTLSFVDRQILSLLVGPMKRDLAISDTRIGLLQGVAFALFYGLMGLPLGRLADTRNRRNVIIVGVVLWSFLTGACSAARSFWSLFLARMGVGVGEATLSPSAFSLISDYFPKEKLGLALSIYSMGIFIGSGIALIAGGSVVDAVTRMPVVTLPLLGAVAPWRCTFLIVGAPGLAIALLLYTVREPIRRRLMRASDGTPARLQLREVVVELRMRWQSVLGISLGMVSQSMGAYAFFAWAPAFLQRIHGWSAGQSGRALGLITLVFGCLGMSVGGRLCDHWQKQGVWEAPLRVAVVSAIGSGILSAFAMTAKQVEWTILLMAPALFFLALPIGSSFAAIQLIFPNQVLGQVSALFLLILNLGGLSLGPLLPGLLNDYVFRNEKMIGPSLAITIGVASTLLLLTSRAAYRPYRIDYERMHASHSRAPENLQAS